MKKLQVSLEQDNSIIKKLNELKDILLSIQQNNRLLTIEKGQKIKFDFKKTLNIK